MANIFLDNPNAYDFIITNTSSFRYPLGYKIIEPNQTISLLELRDDFCVFKKNYLEKPKLRQWFDDGILLAFPINGSSPIVCSWEAGSGGSGGGSGATFDTFRTKTTLDDVVPNFLADEIEVDPVSIQKEVIDLSGDKRVKLTGKIKNFTDLLDTPSDLSSKAGFTVKVNENENGLTLVKLEKEFEFPVPLLTWVVNHNRGLKPLFDIIDLNGTPRKFVNYEHSSDNNILYIRWDDPTAGIIILR